MCLLPDGELCTSFSSLQVVKQVKAGVDFLPRLQAAMTPLGQPVFRVPTPAQPRSQEQEVEKLIRRGLF